VIHNIIGYVFFQEVNQTKEKIILAGIVQRGALVNIYDVDIDIGVAQ